MKMKYITTIKYRNIIYDIILENGVYVIYNDNNIVNNSICNEIINKINSKKILMALNFNRKKLITAGCLALEFSILISNLKTNSVTNNTYLNDYIIREIIESYNKENLTAIETDEYFLKFAKAIYINPYIDSDDKKMILNRYPYISKNTDNINWNELSKIISNLRINKLDYNNHKPIIGTFYVNEDDEPYITLYKDYTSDIFIHEIYHMLHYNKYYWDDVYYYDGKFYGTKEIENISEIVETNKLEKINVYGNMLEEAYTTINTMEEKNTANIPTTYINEVYIFKIYEDIFGRDVLDAMLLSENHAKTFLNLLLSLGLEKEEAISILGRLDIYTALTYDTDIDKQVLLYQMSEDLLNVYEKKFQNTNNDLLKATVQNLCLNLDIDYIKENIKEVTNSSLLDSLEKGDYKPNYEINKEDDIYMHGYNISKIEIDYYTRNNPVVKYYINGNVINFEYIDGKLIHTNSIIKNKRNVDHNDTNLYESYYEYALNTFCSKEYAVYFASIYSNPNLNVDQKSYLLESYDELVGETKETLQYSEYNILLDKIEECSKYKGLVK